MPDNRDGSILSASVISLGEVCYALVRALEFHACWLPAIASTHEKLDAGRAIGYLGLSLSRIHRRFSELTADPLFVAPASLGRAFDGIASGEFCASIEQGRKYVIELVCLVMSRRVNQLSADALVCVADEPTLALLRGCLRELSVWRSDTTFDVDFHGPRVAYGSACLLPPILDKPHREFGLIAKSGGEPRWGELVQSDQGRAQILFEIFADIELSAMEVCASNIVRFRAMPLGFKTDMARQTWDEARHGQACLIRCNELGGPLSKYYSMKVWERWRAGENVIECLCIEQLVQEGNALDSVSWLAGSFRQVGDSRSADMLALFGRDEELHTRIGNRWVSNLLGDNQKYRSAMIAAANRIGSSLPGPAPVAVAARIRGGFPKDFIDEIVRAGAHRSCLADEVIPEKISR